MGTLLVNNVNGHLIGKHCLCRIHWQTLSTNISLTNSTGRSLEKFVNREFTSLLCQWKDHWQTFQWTVHWWSLSLDSSLSISVSRLFTGDSTNGQFLGEHQ